TRGWPVHPGGAPSASLSRLHHSLIKSSSPETTVFTADVILQVLIFGLANGAVVALIALGYTLVYGIIELINFAHGDVYMVGAMFALTLVSALGLKPGSSGGLYLVEMFAILIASMVFCGVLNVVIERFAYRPLRSAPRLAPLISAIGVSFILE